MTDRKRTMQPDWEDVRYFLALARAGSLSGAARSLQVNHATVSRRIASLEASLGRDLFERRRDGYLLNASGQAVLTQAGEMERSALALPEAVDAGRHEGVVRLTTVRSLADRFLVDRLGELRRRAPGISLEVITEIRVMSLARREADIALRLGRPKDSGLVGRKLVDIAYGFYATPAIARRVAAGKAPSFIGYDAEAAGVVEAAWMEKRIAGGPVAFRSNSNLAQAAAARAGFGLAMLPLYLGDQDKGLRKVDIGPAHPTRELWLLSPRELARMPRVRAVLDEIGRLIVGERKLFEGV